MPRRMRAWRLRADAAFGYANTRHRARWIGVGVRHSGRADSRGRAGRGRRLRRQGFALSRRDFRLRRGAAAESCGQMDQRPPGRLRRQQPGVRRNRRCRIGAGQRRPHPRPARRRHRRCRRLLDLSVDGGTRAGAGGEFPARPLSRSALSRPGAGGGDFEAPDRTLSRRRPADFHLRHGAAGRYGGGENRDRRQGNQAAQPRRQRRASLQSRFRHRLGPIRLSGRSERSMRRHRL